MHVAIVGGGIVGLATAYQLTRAGFPPTLIDRDPDGDGTSTGHAGGDAVTEVYPAASPGVWWRAFGWMADPLGPLSIRPRHALKLIPWLTRFAASASSSEVERISRALAALNERVYKDLLPMLEDCGQAGQWHSKGALTVYETESGYRRDSAEWACKRAHGIVAEELSGAEARRMESALGHNVQRAVFTPQWSHIEDPKRLTVALREWLTGHGVKILTAEVGDVTRGSSSPLSVNLIGGKAVTADSLVISAGAWSGRLAQGLGDRVLLESERGYNTTLPHPGVVVGRELIFAERKFVATPMSRGLRIGGAAEFGGLEATANFERSSMLLKLARLYLPDLNTEGGTRWAGHRPTTPDSLPVIGPSRRFANVFYAFGHGHLGFTQAATTGRLVCDLVLQGKPVLDLAPYRVERFSKQG